MSFCGILDKMYSLSLYKPTKFKQYTFPTFKPEKKKANKDLTFVLLGFSTILCYPHKVRYNALSLLSGKKLESTGCLV